MTTSPARTAEPQQLALTPGNVAALLERPLLAIPQEVRAEAFAVWTCHKHLKGLDSPLPMCAALSVWIGRHGLTPPDAVAALGQCLAPGSMGRFAFASDLMTHLAGAAESRIKARREAADLDALRRKALADERDAVPPAEVAAAMDSLKGLFAAPTDTFAAPRETPR